MKRGATKEDIIRATQELIARNGIRAVRVDEIAQRLGISKRTLYEMFEDKSDLVYVCLDEMSRRQREHIAAYRKLRKDTPLKQATSFIHNYINGLFAVDSRFLIDLRGEICFSEHFVEHRKFCREELALIFQNGQQAELVLSSVNARSLADWILDTLLELRLNHLSEDALHLFCHTMLRGAATLQGIDQIDRNS